MELGQSTNFMAELESDAFNICRFVLHVRKKFRRGSAGCLVKNQKEDYEENEENLDLIKSY